MQRPCALFAHFLPLAGLAKLVDALDSDSSVRKDFRVQVPGSACTYNRVAIHSQRVLQFFQAEGFFMIVVGSR